MPGRESSEVQLSAPAAGLTGRRSGAPVRVDWVDVAKGICIILVVMMHTTLGVETALGETGWMHLFVGFAAPFRMPDFFLISGLFLARAISRDWRTFLDRRVVHFAYFYLIWLVISCMLKCPMEGYTIGESLVHIAHGLYNPFSTLWFIYMLALFSLTIKLTARVPVAVMMCIAVAIRLASPETGSVLIDQFAGQFVFFYAGYAFAPLVFRLADRAKASRIAAIAALAVWALFNGALVASGWSHNAAVALVLGFAGAAAIVAVAALIVGSGPGRVLRYMGENSIVIYLAFFIPMATARIAAIKLGLPLDPGTLSFLVLLLAVTTPLLAHRIIRSTPLNFVFDRPRWASIARRRNDSAHNAALTPAE